MDIHVEHGPNGHSPSQRCRLTCLSASPGYPELPARQAHRPRLRSVAIPCSLSGSDLPDCFQSLALLLLLAQRLKLRWIHLRAGARLGTLPPVRVPHDAGRSRS